jgi:AraC-like DNA-binding protein
VGITDARAQIYRGTSSAALLTTYQLDADVTLAQLAQAAGVSVFHFACTFTSPSRYVSRMRLERAMPDIAAGKLSLAEVAFKAGFSSQASFTRVIYRVTGVTPGEYRAHRRPAAWTTRGARPAQNNSKNGQDRPRRHAQH